MRQLIVVFLLLFSRAYAADLHAIMLIDSLAENIDTAMCHNYLKWKDNLKIIASRTKLNLHEHALISHEKSSKSVGTFLNSLSFQPDDVVIFYFCGHGYRNMQKEGPWPFLSWSADNGSFDFAKITELLMDKSPRLLLAMADCCNNFIDMPSKNNLKEQYGPQLAKVIERNYRKLFLETSGLIAVSSSIPGEFSWCWLHRGSCFTLAFFEALRSEVRHPEGTDWPNIFELASKKVKDLQTPQYFIDCKN